MRPVVGDAMMQSTISHTHKVLLVPTALPQQIQADMRFVQNFTLPDFQAKTFTLSISPNFNSFSDTNTKKGGKVEKFTLLAKILYSPQGGTNLTTGEALKKSSEMQFRWVDLESIRPQIKSHG